MSKPLKKSFKQFVIPSMITFLVTGVYISIDGFFVGQAVGDVGIASINMAWPLVSIILAIGTCIGMGGAINVSVHRGGGDSSKANNALGNTLILLLISSIIISALLLVFGKRLLLLLGASGGMLEMGYGYVRVLAWGGVLQVFGNGIIPLLRNQNKVWIAMVLMITNFVIDTVLSGLFVMVLGFGVTGAAIATLIGQFIALIPALVVLMKTEKEIFSFIKLDIREMLYILKTGLPVFGLTFIPSVTILIINYQAVVYGGESAVAAFAVASYVISVGQLLSQGVGEGSQPLVSYYHGANEPKTVRILKHWTYNTGIITALFTMISIIMLRNVIPQFFGVTKETADILQTALPLCAISLPLYAFSRVTTEYFNAIKKSRLASIMVYGEGLIALPICAISLPIAFNLNGVWIIVFMAQLLVSLVGFVLLKLIVRA